MQFEELYDLQADPGERNNLLAGGAAEEHLDRMNSFRKMVQEWHQSARPLPSQFDAAHYQETLERLKSLGYIGGEDESERQGP
jgi:hypothetical protein